MILNRRHVTTRIRLSDLRRQLRPLLQQLRPLSSSNNAGKDAALPSATAEGEEGVISRQEAYRQVHNLDFMKATKILLTTPPKRKHFGFDFHLVQFFFVCMPSLAVYLVAQYARYEIRRMEAEVEVKKKKAAEEEERAREEEKAKEAELRIMEQGSSESEISKVIDRLEALEEVVKEIVDEKKKSDPQVKETTGEPKYETNKDTPSNSSPRTDVPSDDSPKNKQKD